MAFSQSFSIGELTLEQLDVCEKKFDRNCNKKDDNHIPTTPTIYNQNTTKISNKKTPNDVREYKSPNVKEMNSQMQLDVIDESPTDKSHLLLGKSIKERLKNASTSKKSHRKHLKRSKSDPLSNDDSKNSTSNNTTTKQKSNTEDFTSSMFNGTELNWNETKNQSSKLKSKLCDKFSDDEVDSFLKNVKTQSTYQDQHNNTNELISISSSDEDVQVSKIEQMLNSNAFSNVTFNFPDKNINENSENTIQRDEKLMLKKIEENACNQSLQWEDSALFNDFNYSECDILKQNEQNKNDTSVDVLIDADCNLSIQNVEGSLIQDEIESSYLEVSMELSKLNQFNQQISQRSQNSAPKQLNKSIKISNSSKTRELDKCLMNSNSTKLSKDDIANLSQWGCTPIIIKEYLKKGIQSMFEWQIECLSKPEVRIYSSSNE